MGDACGDDTGSLACADEPHECRHDSSIYVTTHRAELHVVRPETGEEVQRIPDRQEQQEQRKDEGLNPYVSCLESAETAKSSSLSTPLPAPCSSQPHLQTCPIALFSHSRSSIHFSAHLQL
jgi:hypothetical protein